MEKSTFCPLPWTSLSIKNNGDLRVCCQANSSPGQGLLLKEDGRPYNASRDNLNEARNSKLIREVRQDMLNGRWNPSCERCRTEEASGIRSRRLYSIDLYGTDSVNFEKAAATTKPDGELFGSHPVVDLDLRFGNTCNLKCRMCGPKDSNAWYSDHVKLYGTRFADDGIEVELSQSVEGQWSPRKNDYDWHESPSFWTQLRELAPHVRHIYVVGGEPMMIKRHFDLLEELVASGEASKVSIEYNTNMTVLPEQALRLWPNFKAVYIGASIDAVGVLNDYIRSGSRFATIERNLKRVDELPGNVRVWIATTVSAYNIINLTDLMKWKLESGFQNVNSTQRNPLITCHPLHKPHCLNVKVLPIKAKELVRATFAEFYPWLEEWMTKASLDDQKREALRLSAHKILDGYLSFMMAEDWSQRLPEFIKYTKDLDQIRGEDFGSLSPLIWTHVSKG